MRVFPRRTKATPDDDMVRIGTPPGMFDEADEVHISVTFTWDLPHAEWLEKQWRHVAQTQIGGPATGERAEEFTPGMYLKNGYVITSRGCPNKCWFCSVWKRDGDVRELPITDGWMVQDDNLLACSDSHLRAVFDMLKRQPCKPEFTGGLEAARLKEWHVEELRKLKPKQLFFAYDTPDDYDPLYQAGQSLKRHFDPYPLHNMRCYVLCGYPGDTIANADLRMRQTIEAGFTPMAMLYKDHKQGHDDRAWRTFQREWARPAIIYGKKT